MLLENKNYDVLFMYILPLLEMSFEEYYVVLKKMKLLFEKVVLDLLSDTKMCFWKRQKYCFGVKDLRRCYGVRTKLIIVCMGDYFPRLQGDRTNCTSYISLIHMYVCIWESYDQLLFFWSDSCREKNKSTLSATLWPCACMWRFQQSLNT